MLGHLLKDLSLLLLLFTNRAGISMQSSYLRFIIGILILVASLGLGGCASDLQKTDVVSATVAALPSAGDQHLADTVQAALHADPYFYDKHVTVSIEHDNVVLRGFVASAWDLIRAKQIAAKAAAGRPVIDDLSINPIEEPSTGVRR